MTLTQALIPSLTPWQLCVHTSPLALSTSEHILHGDRGSPLVAAAVFLVPGTVATKQALVV